MKYTGILAILTVLLVGLSIVAVLADPAITDDYQLIPTGSALT